MGNESDNVSVLLLEAIEKCCVRNSIDLLDKIKGDDLLKLKNNSGGNLLHCIATGIAKGIKKNDLLQLLTDYIKIADKIKEKLDYFSENNYRILHSYVNHQDNNGNTPLHLSVCKVAPDFVFFLIKNGADISSGKEMIKNKKGKSVYDLAKKSGKKSLDRADGVLLESYKLLKYPPPTFTHQNRFSITSAYLLGLLAKVAYKGEGSDRIDNGKIEMTHSNKITHALLSRWGFTNTYIVEILDSRGFITEYEEKNTKNEVINTYRFVSFKGTDNIHNWVSNIISISSFDEGGIAYKYLELLKAVGEKVEPITFNFKLEPNGECIGFSEHLSRISGLLVTEIKRRNVMPLYITGHSLGGAAGALFFKNITDILKDTDKYPGENNISLYTFGQPRPGSINYATDNKNYFSNNAYIIQKSNDIVTVLPSFTAKFRHCGSLRYIDEDGYLANDMHYKVHDISRYFKENLKKSDKISLFDHRNAWTLGLQFLTELTNSLSIHESVSLPYLSQHKPALDIKSVKNIKYQPLRNSADTNHTRFKDKLSFSLKKYHSMDSYLDCLLKLKKKIDLPCFSHIDAITSSKNTVKIPNDFKVLSTIEKQREVYNDWIDKYINKTDIPMKIRSFDDTTIEKWLLYEKKVLLCIRYCEENILQFYNEYFDKNFDKNFVFDFNTTGEFSPMVSHGLQHIFYLLSQYNEPNSEVLFSILSEFYYSLPDKILCFSYVEQNEKQSETCQFIDILRTDILFNEYFLDYIEKLRNIYNTPFIEKCVNYLYTLPYKDGYRPSVKREYEKWDNMLLDLLDTSNTKEEYSTIPKLSIIIGDEIKRGYLNPKYREQFNNRLNNITKTGINVVYPMGNMFFKEAPNLPGLERASEILAKLIIGEGIPCSTIGRIDFTNSDNKKVAVPVLISEAVGSHNLKYYQNEENNFDKKIFSQLAIFQMLTLVEDAKEDNFQIGRENENEPWKLYSIDNDHILVPEKTSKLNFKSILFCCNEIYFPIHPEVRKQLRYIKFELILEKWLKKLDNIYKLCVEKEKENKNKNKKRSMNASSETQNDNIDKNNFLFSEDENKIIEKHKIQSLTEKELKNKNKTTKGKTTKGKTIIRPHFAETMVEKMYERMRSLKSLLVKEDITLMQIFKEILPKAAKYYNTPDILKSETMKDRFNILTKKLYDKQKLGDTEVSVTKNSPDSILKMSGVGNPSKKSRLPFSNTPKIKYNTPSIQLDIMVNQINNSDYTKPALDALKSSGDNFSKEFKELGMTCIQENFLDKEVQKILEVASEEDKKEIGNKICKTLFDMKGFKFLNLSNIDNPLLSVIIVNNKFTLEKLILRNCNIPTIDTGDLPYGVQFYSSREDIENSTFSFNWVSYSKILADYNKLKRSMFKLQNLKSLDITGCNDISGLFFIIPFNLYNITQSYSIKGLWDLYHSNQYTLLDIMRFGIHDKISNIKIITEFGSNENVRIQTFKTEFINNMLPETNNVKVVCFNERENNKEDEITKVLQKCKKLLSFKFSCSGLTNEQINSILYSIKETLPDLKSLFIDDINESFDSKILGDYIMSNKSLTQLILDGKDIIDLTNVYNAILSCESLKFLTISPYIIKDISDIFNHINKMLISLSFQSSKEHTEERYNKKLFHDLLSQKPNDTLKYLLFKNPGTDDFQNLFKEDEVKEFLMNSSLYKLTILNETKEFDISTLIPEQTTLCYPKCDITKDNYETNCIQFFSSIHSSTIEQIKDLVVKNDSLIYMNTYDNKSIIDLAPPNIKDYLLETYPLLDILNITKGLAGYHTSGLVEKLKPKYFNPDDLLSAYKALGKSMRLF